MALQPSPLTGARGRDTDTRFAALADVSLRAINLPAGSWWGKRAWAAGLGHHPRSLLETGQRWGGGPGLLPAASRR